MIDRGNDPLLPEVLDREPRARTGFLEFGSTTIKFYLVHGRGERKGQVERELKIPWNLGYDVFQHSRISPSTVSRCLAILRDLRQQFPDVQFDSVTAVGTAALREAQNAEVFQRVVGEELGLKIQVIEGGIEAFLLETGFRPSVTAYPTGLFDLGGGSLELVEYLTPFSTKKTSLPIGAIRLHCQLRRTKDMFAYVTEGRRVVSSALREHLSEVVRSYTTLLGTGGTVRAIAELVGHDELTLPDVSGLLDRELRGRAWDNLAPHRRKVLLAGLIVVESLFVALRLDNIVHENASVKRGLIDLANLVPGAAG